MANLNDRSKFGKKKKKESIGKKTRICRISFDPDTTAC